MMADIMIIYMWKHPWIQKIGQYQKIPPPQSLKKQTLRTVEIVAVVDVHVDAPVVEDTEIYDEPPKEIPKTVKKGAKSSAKGLTKKKTQPDESDQNSFVVETEKDLAEWYRENEIFL